MELGRLRVTRTLLALLLTLLATTALAECPPYDRKDYRHWIDADRDCQNTRHEVLIEESLTPVMFKTDKGCKVVSGNWLGSYSGDVFTDASKLDIDHLVPLKEAHESGGYAWDADRRRDYANDLSDPNTLIAVDRGLNRQKGAGDPSEWLPPNKAYQTEYAEAWVAVKVKWGLTADKRELAALRALLGDQVDLPREAEEMDCSVNKPSDPPELSSGQVSVVCGSKKYCKEMGSCEEAKAFLTECRLTGLDRNKDGVPCESLCKD